MPGAPRFRPVGQGRWSRRLEDRLAIARWRLWQLRRRRLRGGAPVLLGPGAWIRVTGTGRVRAGRDVRARGDLTLAVEGELTLGDDVFLGRGTHITCFHRVAIGSGTRFGERVSVHDENHVMEPLADREARRTAYEVAPVTIGERVWLAANVVVLAGVTIGDDTVVAAGSVVVRDLPAGVLAAGVPAAVLRPLA